MADDSVSFLWKGVVVGTPRTYGDRKTEDIWRAAIKRGVWEGTVPVQPLESSVHLDFEFRVHPRSRSYNSSVSPNGPDLDTLVIGALAGLIDSRNQERPTLRHFAHCGLCRFVTATKQIVESDELAGFTLHARLGDVLAIDEIASDVPLSFLVTRQNLKSDRRRAVQAAAEQANHDGFRAPKDSRIEIRLAFATGLTRNPLSIDWLEAVIDGLGASRVGSNRFFDGPATQEFGYDDSVVFRLLCAQVNGLPNDAGLHVSVAPLKNF